MTTFVLWLLLVESGRFDRDGFNDVFRRQLAELLPNVADENRRASLEAMQGFDWVGYVLAALRHAGYAEQQEREQAAHDVVVYLLVQPGQLFVGYNANTNGPMEARFRLAVRNSIRNLLRTRRRRPRAASIGHAAGEVPAEAIPDRHRDDDEVLAAFRAYLGREIGEDAVRLLDRRLEGISLRQLAGDQGFGLRGWTLRRLVQRVREAALAFAHQQGDDGFVRAVERLLPTSRGQIEENFPWRILAG